MTKQPKITEAAFQRSVLDLIHLYGLWCYHTYDSRRSQPGWPDLVIVGPQGMILRELKTDSGKTTSEQDRVLSMLIDAGQDAGIWRPSDMRTGRIRAELATIAGRTVV